MSPNSDSPSPDSESEFGQSDSGQCESDFGQSDKSVRGFGLFLEVRKKESEVRILKSPDLNRPTGYSISNKILDTIRTFQVPRTVKQIGQYLELFNYLRKFLPNYATLSSPLQKLIRNLSGANSTRSLQCSQRGASESSSAESL